MRPPAPLPHAHAHMNTTRETSSFREPNVFNFRLTCSEIVIKVKIRLSLCFNWAPCHECVLGEWRYSSTHYLTSASGEGMGRDLDCMADVLMGFHRPTFPKPNTEFNAYLAPCDFWAFPTMKRELRGKKFWSDQRSAARFREVGGALYEVRQVLRKRDRHRTSTKFRLGVIMWVHELFKRPS
jgi:hypothetical protein